MQNSPQKETALIPLQGILKVRRASCNLGELVRLQLHELLCPSILADKLVLYCTLDVIRCLY